MSIEMVSMLNGLRWLLILMGMVVSMISSLVVVLEPHHDNRYEDEVCEQIHQAFSDEVIGAHSQC